MNIWLISAFEPVPVDGTRPMRFMGIADSLTRAGHNVVFWSSSFNHFKKKQRVDDDKEYVINDRYKLYLVYAKPYSRNLSFKRLISHSDFARKLEGLIYIANPPDIILMAYPPIHLARTISEYSIKKNIPCLSYRSLDLDLCYLQ